MATNTKHIEDVDFIEIPPMLDFVADNQSRSTFQKRDIESKTFTAASWYLANFGVVNHEVWWGYKIGYYILVFPLCLAIGISVDVAMLLFRLLIYIAKRLIDVAFNGVQPAIKIACIAAAIIIIVLFINKIGWDGMNAAFDKIFGKFLCD